MWVYVHDNPIPICMCVFVCPCVSGGVCMLIKQLLGSTFQPSVPVCIHCPWISSVQMPLPICRSDADMSEALKLQSQSWLLHNVRSPASVHWCYADRLTEDQSAFHMTLTRASSISHSRSTHVHTHTVSLSLFISLCFSFFLSLAYSTSHTF